MGGTPREARWDPQTYLTTCSSRLACSSACSASVTSWGQTGVRLASPDYPAHSVPTPAKPTHLPEDDTGVTGASEGAVVQPAAVQPPDLVVVGIQRPHTLIVFDGPELHEPIGATGLGLGGDLALGVSQLPATLALSPAHSPGQQLCATAHKGHLQHRSIVSFKRLQGWNGKGVKWHQVGARPGGGGSLP